MAKHEVILHENKTPTKVTAPFTGIYISKLTKDLPAACKRIAKLSGLPEIKVQTILTGAFDMFAEIEKERAVRIHFDGGYVGLRLHGNFDSADAAFNPEKNSLDLAYDLDDEIRNSLADEMPTIVTDETSTKVTLHTVADVAERRPYFVIHGQRPFKVTGLNLVMNDEGARIYLQNNKGTTFPCTVTEVISKQEFIANTNALLDGGDYSIVVESRGGDAEGQLQSTPPRKVKYLRVLPPEPVMTGVQCGENEPNVVWFEDGKLTITGEHLDGVTQAKLEAEFGSQTVTCDITNDIETITETKIETIADGFENNSPKPDMQWSDKQAKLVLVKGEVRGEYAVRFKAQA